MKMALCGNLYRPKEFFPAFLTKKLLRKDRKESRMQDYKKAFEELEKKLDLANEQIRAYEYDIMKYRLAGEAQNMGLWDMDVLDAEVTNQENEFRWSQEIRTMLGFTDEHDFPNVLYSLAERMHPEDLKATEAAFAAHVNDRTGKTPYDIEYRLQLKNGEYRHFHAMGTTLRDETGKPLRVAGTVRDITDKKLLEKAAQNALEEANRTSNAIATVLNQSGAMIYVADPDTDEILFLTDSLREHFNIADDAVGRPCYAVFHDGKTQRCSWCPWSEHETGMDKVYTSEGSYYGTQGYYRRACRYVMWPGERKVRLQYIADLTDSWQMQNDLSHSQRMLHAINSAATLLLNSDIETFDKALYQSMTGLARVLNIDRITIWQNSMVEGRLYCTLVYDWTGDVRSYYGEQLTINAAYGEVIPGWEEVLSGGNCINSLVRDMLPAARRQLSMQGVLALLAVPVFMGDQFWGFVSFDNCKEEILFTKDEESILWSGGVLLVSAWVRNEMRAHQREISEQLELALERANIADMAKGEFLRTVSHEIRTPMNVILGLTEIHLLSENLDSGIRDAFDRIHASGDLLLGIINDILDMSRIEAGKLEVFPDEYETTSLISDTANTNLMRGGSTPVEFRLSVDENMPTVMFGDELRIKQILNNLLSNAFKYTDAGEVHLSFYTEPASIVVEGAADENTITLVIEVSDTGHGMTREQLDQMFEPYTRFSVDSGRTITGSGLGMPIVRNLLDLMNGRIEMESEPGKGSRFVVRIPQGRVGTGVLGESLAANLQRFDLFGATKMARVQITREPMPYGSVLVVDDVESNISVALGLLAPYALNVDVARSGFEAIEIIESGKVYDVIFMDHMMPRMDGMEAMQIIKGKGYDNPVVVLTANALVGQAEIFFEAGFDDFISKPIDLRQLNYVLNRFIRDRYLAESADVVEAARQHFANRELVLSEINGSGAEQPLLNQRLIRAFIRDATTAAAVLNSIIDRPAPWSEEDRQLFEVHAHGMKSALSLIGAREQSAVARKLERKAFEASQEELKVETAEFLTGLAAIVKDLTEKNDAQTDEAEAEADLREKLSVIRSACSDFDVNTLHKTINQLRAKPHPEAIASLLVKISRYLLLSDFDRIVEAVDQYLDGSST